MTSVFKKIILDSDVEAGDYDPQDPSFDILRKIPWEFDVLDEYSDLRILAKVEGSPAGEIEFHFSVSNGIPRITIYNDNDDPIASILASLDQVALLKTFDTDKYEKVKDPFGDDAIAIKKDSDDLLTFNQWAEMQRRQLTSEKLAEELEPLATKSAQKKPTI